MNKLTQILPFIVIATALNVNGQVVFDGNNYVASNQNFINRVNPVDGSALERGFAAATPSSNYTGPDFFAGYSVTADKSVTGLGFSRQRVEQNTGAQFGGNDFVYIRAQSTGAGNSTPVSTTFGVAQAVFFPSVSDFSLGSFELSVRAMSRSNNLPQTGRFMVQVGGTYYLSAQTMNLTNTESTHSYDFGGDLTWAVYDPATSINFDQSAASFNTISLGAVQGAGLYAENDNFTSDNTSPKSNYVIAEYQLGSLTAIPEPSTIALFLGLAVLSVGLLRRRR